MSSITRVEGILFDAGQVLVTTDEMATAQFLSEKTAIKAEEICAVFQRMTKYQEFEEGRTDSERFLESIVDMLARIDPMAPAITLPEAEEAFAAWITGEVKGMTDIVGRIRKGVRKYIASNTNQIHWTRVIDKAPVVKQFGHDAIFSYVVGARKPNELFFREALKHAGVEAAAALLVDDRPENCEAFEQMGGHAIQFDCRKQDARWLANELAAYSVF